MQRQLAGLIFTVLLLPMCLQAQEPRLGTIDFPSSGSAAAQPHFIRGVLFLHSFEYESAAAAFRKAQQADPGFALAYWGEAMTYNHSLWDDRDTASARAVLRRLAPTLAERRATAKTERERMYLDAIEQLWAEGPKAERDTAYMLAMEDLTRRYPGDVEAKAFYALSILGLSNTTRVVTSYMRAAAIAQEIFRDHPNHPGAAHYIIHSFDDPTHAPLGLPAARAYSRIAPDAAHAQHMTTHIFVASGMWDDVVSQNEVAAGLTSWGPGHYTSWLTYGLLQAGRYEEAAHRLAAARELAAQRSTAGARSYLAFMRAYHVINTERWSDPSLEWTIALQDGWPRARVADLFLSGYAAFKRGEIERGQKALGDLGQLVQRLGDDPVMQVLASELDAVAALQAGDHAKALRLMERATAIEDSMPAEYGPPDIVKPSHELYGEMLMALDRPVEARSQFELALMLAPNRARTLVGLIHAASAAGDTRAVERARAALDQAWHAADPALVVPRNHPGGN